jgi:hypothetical protein
MRFRVSVHECVCFGFYKTPLRGSIAWARNPHAKDCLGTLWFVRGLSLHKKRIPHKPQGAKSCSPTHMRKIVTTAAGRGGGNLKGAAYTMALHI